MMSWITKDIKSKKPKPNPELYYVGKVCDRCKSSDRYKKSKKCVACHANDKRKYRGHKLYGEGIDMTKTERRRAAEDLLIKEESSYD